MEELRSVQGGLSGADRNLVELLANWEDNSVEAQQKLQGSARLIDVLQEYRSKSLPIVAALVAMLPPDDRTRRNAEEKIKETRRTLPSPDLARISDAWFEVPHLSMKTVEEIMQHAATASTEPTEDDIDLRDAIRREAEKSLANRYRKDIL